MVCIEYRTLCTVLLFSTFHIPYIYTVISQPSKFATTQQGLPCVYIYIYIERERDQWLLVR